MRLRNRLAAVAGGLMLSIAATCANAAAPNAAGALNELARDTGAVEQVRHGCYRHRGHWHCPRHHRRHHHHHGYYGYAPGFYGYGPSFRFNFGRHRHHHGHHHHHRGHRHW